MRLPNAPPGLLHHPVPGLRGTASLNANRHAVCYFTVLLCGIPLSTRGRGVRCGTPASIGRRGSGAPESNSIQTGTLRPFQPTAGPWRATPATAATAHCGGLFQAVVHWAHQAWNSRFPVGEGAVGSSQRLSLPRIIRSGVCILKYISP